MFETVKLSNGLTLVMEKIPAIRSIAFGIWVKNGSRNESPHTNGISHFIEHMLFKGTTTRTAKDIADEMDAVGGQVNAYTSKEHTCYYTRTLDTHFDSALDILADMFFNSRFSEAEIERERNVIIEEISMYEDAPEELVHDIMQLRIWQDNPLGFPILGTEEIIKTFTHDTFKMYFDENYCPENIVIAVAGNLDFDETAAKMESYFGKFRRKKPYEPNKFQTVYKPVVITKEKDIEQVHISMGFPSISVGSEDSYVLAVLNTIFGGGMSSRLFQRLREQLGLVYSVYSYNSSYSDTGLFSIYAGLNPSQTEKAIKVIIEEIELLRSNKITELQLNRTKDQLKTNYLLSLESSSSRMSAIGKSQLVLNKLLTQKEIVDKIEAVTLPRLDEMTARVFNLEKMSLSIVGNIGDFDINSLDINGLDLEGKLLGGE